MGDGDGGEQRTQKKVEECTQLCLTGGQRGGGLCQ